MWNKVMLNTDGSSCDDLDGYEMEWVSSAGEAWGDNKVNIGSGDTIEWTHTGRSALTYYYRICAFDDSGHYSAPSSSISIYCDTVLEYELLSDSKTVAAFTPNGDGIADTLDINFTLNQASTTVEVRVLLSTGGYITISSATYNVVLSTSVTWSPSGLPDGTYSVEIWINGESYASTAVALQGSAQDPPSANNYPNPFIISRDGFTKIRWRMAALAPVKIAVYNTLGMLVKTWKISQNELTLVGENWYEHQWNGRNGKGREVASGIYICLIRGGGVDETIKIAVIR